MNYKDIGKIFDVTIKDEADGPSKDSFRSAFVQIREALQIAMDIDTSEYAMMKNIQRHLNIMFLDEIIKAMDNA